MLRKVRIITIALLLALALPVCSMAADETSFRIYNSSTVTSNLDATYLQGDVSAACGQKIEVKGTDGVVAEKQLPNTGAKYKFRIKIPRAALSEKGVNSFAVTAMTAEGEKIRTTYFRVRYKARKDQEIRLTQKEYKVQLPGDAVAISASSSAGLDLAYSSSNEDVVKVDEQGNIEPVGEGTAEVEVIQSNDNEYEDASETVTVSVKEVPHYTIRFHLGKPEPADESEESLGDTDEDGSIIHTTSLIVSDTATETIDEDTDDIIVEQKIPVGETAKLHEAAESKGDYEFIGWSATSTGYPKYDNAEEVTDLAKEGDTVDLYAIWHGERAQMAVDWAVALAADNRYGYGQGTPKCNICGLMPKKQFTCMPFVAASYSHGPEDPIMLSGGKHVVHLNNANFRGELGQVWEKVGLCRNLSISDLEPGDIVIKWSDHDNSGHAWMYVGGDQIVEATPASSYADQIAVKSGAAARLRSYGSGGKNYVMRYRY
ncbi:MAG: hypothetical protein MJ128_03620 [Mogibacterium sp.]|nr:hypothetical protein [Mogibacterium sp.]